MSHVFAFILCLASFAALASATNRQQRDLFGKALRPATTRMLRLGATAALLLALSVLVLHHGWGLGLVMFSGHTSLAAGIVVCGLIGYVQTHKRAAHRR
jgi:hypothetical protein